MSAEFFYPLDDVLTLRFLPAQTSQPAFGPIEREIISLPACHEGLGIIVPTVHFSFSFSSSSNIAAPLIARPPIETVYVMQA